MMFGYACNETEELMPMPILLAHKLCHRLSEVRKAGILPYLRPDGKSQVTVEYEDDKPVRIDTVLLSSQHRPNVDIEELMKPDFIDHVIRRCFPGDVRPRPARAGQSHREVRHRGAHGRHRPHGRKIIVDTYGGMARHGGGCFSGKDPTKVDRSAAYAARYVAKNVVAAGLADRFEVQLAYAIGVARPVSVMVEAFGTEKVDLITIEALIREHFDLRPAAIIRDLKLRQPIYKRTAAYGHFGRLDKDFAWEHTDKAEALRSEAGL